MKLIDDSGKFAFIRNSEVVVDRNLPKYEKIKKILEVKKDDKECMTTPYVSSDKLKTEAIDAMLRQKIMELGNPGLREYLRSESASDFNKEFSDILLGEVDVNKYSTAIYSNQYLDYDASVPRMRSKFLERLRKSLHILFPGSSSIKKINDRSEVLGVLEFFSTIHIDLGKEKEFVDKISGFFDLLEDAKKMGQTAQEDILCQKIVLNIYESVLSVNGFTKYIDFVDLERLKKPGKRVIDIDYIENFSRPVPKNIVKIKLKCDSLGVFDNYCVMYYDPSGNTYQKKESARRDPILFGLINHSPRLYYVADWIDDLCDLTLDKIAQDLSIVKENK